MAATDEAIDGIRQLIASGEFHPGDRLPTEHELAARLGVSRGSLREAVRALELIGVVQARQGDGTYLTSLSSSRLIEVVSLVVDFSHDGSVLQLFEVRRLLEPLSASLAAARATPEQLDEALAALESMRRAATPEAFVEADQEFHAAVARAAGNPALAGLLATLAGPTLRARIGRAVAEQRANEDTIAEHERIYEALVAREPELARAASAVHVHSVERWMRGALAETTASAGA